jgi:choline-sulfatase
MRALLAALCLLVACSSEPQPSPGAPGQASLEALPRPNFLVIDIDSMRADRIHHERDGMAVSPILKKIAEAGVSFEQAYAQSGWTMPALATLLTGRYPIGARPGGGMVWAEDSARTLPEIFAMYDYQSAVFWGATLGSDYAEPSRGFGQVFRTEPGAGMEATEQVARWLREEAQEPFFAFVHTIDLHAPVPRPPHNAMHRWHEPQPACDEDLHLGQLHAALEPTLGEADARDHVIAHYDATVLFYNHQLAGVLEALRETGLGPRTVVVVTSNHGEDLFEHGIVGHSLLYDTVLRVPLIIRDPAAPGKGRTVKQPVQGVDLAPTLLARAGIPVDLSMDGQSLLPLLGLDQGDYEERPLYAMTSPRNAAMRSRGRKLIFGNLGLTLDGDQTQARPDERGAAPILELYDLNNDSAEQRNLAPARPDEADAMMRSLEAWLQQQHRRAQSGTEVRIDAHAREVMQERGYWEHVTERDASP